MGYLNLIYSYLEVCFRRGQLVYILDLAGGMSKGTRNSLVGEGWMGVAVASVPSDVLSDRGVEGLGEVVASVISVVLIGVTASINDRLRRRVVWGEMREGIGWPLKIGSRSIYGYKISIVDGSL